MTEEVTIDGKEYERITFSDGTKIYKVWIVGRYGRPVARELKTKEIIAKIENALS